MTVPDLTICQFMALSSMCKTSHFLCRHFLSDWWGCAWWLNSEANVSTLCDGGTTGSVDNVGSGAFQCISSFLQDQREQNRKHPMTLLTSFHIFQHLSTVCSSRCFLCQAEQIERTTKQEVLNSEALLVDLGGKNLKNPADFQWNLHQRETDRALSRPCRQDHSKKAHEAERPWVFAVGSHGFVHVFCS